MPVRSQPLATLGAVAGLTAATSPVVTDSESRGRPCRHESAHQLGRGVPLGRHLRRVGQHVPRDSRGDPRRVHAIRARRAPRAHGRRIAAPVGRMAREAGSHLVGGGGNTGGLGAAILEAALDRRAPSRLTILALVTGFCGVGLLSLPQRAVPQTSDLGATLALLAAGACWAAGSVLQQRRRVQVEPAVSSGYQQVFAGLGFALMALRFRESPPHITTSGWVAWGYLVVFGSLLAFTSYVQVLRLLPVSVATTAAYVNPMVAVFLGWLVLREGVTPWTVAGSALVLLGVGGVFHDRARQLGMPRATPPLRRREAET